jgi:hypothetical protein
MPYHIYHITDGPAIEIAQSCMHLKTLDLLNLDYLTLPAVCSFATHCPLLTTLNCEGCDLTAKEYASVVGRVLPFAGMSFYLYILYILYILYLNIPYYIYI